MPVDTHHIASIGVHFVTIGTLDEHRLTIDEELTVANLNLAETYILHKAFDKVAFAVLEVDT